MAALSFVLRGDETQCLTVTHPISYELIKEEGVPCDALRLRFLCDVPLFEVRRAEVYAEEAILFSGYVDTQREENGKTGCSVFLYARSAECLLLDNEAEPGTYLNPSVKALAAIHAAPLGLTCAAEGDGIDGEYYIGKGCTCYGAIDELAYAQYGRHIKVSPQGDIVIPQGGVCVTLNAESVMSEKRCINRGGALSGIDYKAYRDTGYCHHFRSRTLEKRGICSVIKINLQALPPYQRKNALQQKMRESVREYDCFELQMEGFCKVQPYDRVVYNSDRFGSLDGYEVSAVCHSLNADGEKTVIRFIKATEWEEITYVD